MIKAVMALLVTFKAINTASPVELFGNFSFRTTSAKKRGLARLEPEKLQDLFDNQPSYRTSLV
jgi:hypothetical protein